MILAGKDISNIIIDELNESKKLAGAKFSVISVGDNKSAMSYFKGILSKAEKLNIEVNHVNLDENTSNEEYIAALKECNDSDTNGILLLTPVPSQIDFELVSSYIDPSKDVDCLSKLNSGNFYLTSEDSVGPCTAKAVMEILKVNNYDLTSKKVCIIGASNIVGKPLAKLMLDANATVTVCNYYTDDVPSYSRECDVVVSACGVAKLVKKEYLKKDAIVIDVGINFIDGKMCGDVDFEDCSEVTKNITPVPGGVGSVTSTIIFKNMSLLK